MERINYGGGGGEEIKKGREGGVTVSNGIALIEKI